MFRSHMAASRMRRGNAFENAILHIALTPVPAIPNLAAGIKVAASRDAGDVVNVPVMTLATEVDAMDEFKTQLIALLGLEIAEGASAEEVDAAIIAAVEELMKPEEAEEAVDDAVADEPAVVPPTAEQLSRGRVDATMLSMMDESAADKLDVLLSVGKINKTTRDALVGPLGKVNKVCLSMAKPGEAAQKTAREIIAALDKLPALDTTEKTPGQRTTLSRGDDKVQKTATAAKSAYRKNAGC